MQYEYGKAIAFFLLGPFKVQLHACMQVMCHMHLKLVHARMSA